MADILNRLDAIKDDSSGSPGSTLASYSYLGVGTIVKEDFEQPDVRLEYFFDSAYGGFDRFGRVVDQRWYDYGANADRDRYTYGYDRASNRLYRENATASGKDEFYTYDRVNRLVNSDRGDLNVGKTAISGIPVREEDWGLDMTGNWSAYVQKTSGSADLDQDRTHNEVNEITDISETTGTAWATPVHDRAGNMTSVPKPASLANSLSLKWDAWNRIVEAKDGEVVIGVYEYDPLNRRVTRHVDSQAPNNPNGIDTYIHYFYNSAWQVLETRDTTTESVQPENLQPDWQYVWSPRYIDAPVLRDKNTDTDGLCDDERIYYLNDANFNITTLANTGGDAVERYLYDAYGRGTVYVGAWTSVLSASSFANVMMYTGRERDAETGLYHYRNRYYDCQLGEFNSRDRISSHDNPYCYVGSSPTNVMDPLGLCRVFVIASPVLGSRYYHTCIQVEGDVVRDVTRQVPVYAQCCDTIDVWVPDSSGGHYERRYKEYQQCVGTKSVTTQEVVHEIWSIELLRGTENRPGRVGWGPTGGIGDILAHVPLVGMRLAESTGWGIFVAPMACSAIDAKTPGTMWWVVTPNSGNEWCAIANRLLAQGKSVGWASHQQSRYYLFDEHGQWTSDARTCNSVTWEVLVNAGVTVTPAPLTISNLPGWGNSFSRQQ